MLEVRSPNELRAEADAFHSKAEKHRRWGMILANAEETDLATEHFGQAKRAEELAAMLRRAAHAMRTAR